MTPTAWQVELSAQLIKKFGTTKGRNLSQQYLKSFPHHYIEKYSINTAIEDIEHIEKLSSGNPLEIKLYQSDKMLRIRLYQYEKHLPLFELLPTFENLDLLILDEEPFHLSIAGKSIWINDFCVTYSKSAILNIDHIKDIFAEDFLQIRQSLIESDGFNKLVINAGLTSREIVILRAYAKYLQQIKFHFTQSIIENTLIKYVDITRNLVTLFKAKFNPDEKNSLQKVLSLEKDILKQLESVTILDEDRILRRLLDVMNATIRTNYFQTDGKGKAKSYLSFKLNSKAIPELPLPQPLYEIFVYSPRFEGIHLRNTKVARGGIRWSTRGDFRTEILGLMKAQVVKNAVIVPSGAKGGFVLKTLPPGIDRATMQQEVIHCYKLFISGLLDLTDNLKKGKVIHPKQVVYYDDDDPYLVVAADKGTASFSDIANQLSADYDFWLGDAFASGGSAGYDHKKMGITARGAWESIKRHFAELNINIADTDFTVIGIGDMSGDVFGNGMIYSKRIKLLAAFDHRDIFLDPNPNPETSYEERLRLFRLPTSSWQDYQQKLISKGGGVYSRTLKSIPISPEVKKALGIQENTLTPNELVRAILKAPVDLFYNGGIGTYVKASAESAADVGDKTNDFCRVNGEDLRCKIVGEGGNLGFTQLGRIEYALHGGLINTDFIDNSAGVDCSDHEVNIKILLNKEVLKGKLTEKSRNQLLSKMTNEVASLVLLDNYQQAFAISFSALKTSHNFTALQISLDELERNAALDRSVEYLPDDKKILERKAAGHKFTRPELAILFAYTKIYIQNELLKSDIIDDPYLSKIIYTAFPKMLHKTYAAEISQHDLRREIIATQLSNLLVNEMGLIYVQSMHAETGASVAEIVRAHRVASEIFEVPDLQQAIKSLDFKIPINLQYELLQHLRKLVTISTRWFLRGNRLSGNLENIITHYAKNIKTLEKIIPQLMTGITKKYQVELTQKFVATGLPQSLAKRIALIRALYTALNIIEMSTINKMDLITTAKLYFAVGEKFNLVWFRDQIGIDNREGFWNVLAKLTLRDELDVVQRKLCALVFQDNKNNKDAKKAVENWITNHYRPFDRWEKLQALLHSTTDIDYNMFFVALRELSNTIPNE